MQNPHRGRTFGLRQSQPLFDFTNLSSSARGRGGWAPRNSRGKLRASPRPNIAQHPLGELLEKVEKSDLQPHVGCDVENAVITACTYVTSYNWQSSKSPTILVPGKPALWTPLSVPQQLKEDQGEYFRDPNAARFPEYPMEPAVQAVLKDPSFGTSEIDIFACGSTMGNLLRFVRSIDVPFRFSIQLVGDTVFLIRKENDPREVIEGVRGFGHTFPEAYTTWEADVKRSESHQRIVRYKFGGLECMVRFECDGYIREHTEKTRQIDPNVMDKENKSEDLLTQALDQTSVSQGHEHVSASLTVISGGSEVPQSSIFDLKTRSGKYNKKIDMSDFLPVLYLKQIPKFVVAYHNGYGLFPASGIHVNDIECELHQWETENGEALKRLAILLKKIVNIAKADQNALLEVYSPCTDHLEIRRQHGDGSHVLPLSLRDRWTGLSKKQAIEKESTEHRVDEGFANVNDSISSESDEDDGGIDFTGCSADTCGYCGGCSY